MSFLEGFRFRGSDSLMHRLDPRVKFVYVCVIFVIAVMYTDFLVQVLLFILQFPAVYLGRVYRQWMKSMRGAVFLAVFILVSILLSQYFYYGYNLLLSDFEYALAMSMRFIVLVASFSIFFLTTSPDYLGLALEQSGVPYQFCFAFVTAVRFVPVLADEAQRIIDAQKSRGMELEKGSFLKRVRNYIPILIPLIVNAVKRSLELAESMESRAWGSSKKRSSYYTLKLRRGDYALAAISIAALSISLYVKYLVMQGLIRIPMVLPLILRT
ncbi:energy-coupling factor transporter transmembrane protein EcfT [Candidatus Bathyarchaeota archaeon]|nr:MAG: energy-coupling factor transporter transmembrane protein EcfT [Candidatus Bathyarchaeota archaeon]